MAKAAKELGLALGGLLLGVALFLVSGAVEYGIPHCGGCAVWGYPYYWRLRSTGPGPNSIPFEPQYQVDLVFWLIVAVVIVEIAVRLIPTYISRRRSVTASASS